MILIWSELLYVYKDCKYWIDIMLYVVVSNQRQHWFLLYLMADKCLFSLAIISSIQVHSLISIYVPYLSKQSHKSVSQRKIFSGRREKWPQWVTCGKFLFIKFIQFYLLTITGGGELYLSRRRSAAYLLLYILEASCCSLLCGGSAVDGRSSPIKDTKLCF